MRQSLQTELHRRRLIEEAAQRAAKVASGYVRAAASAGRRADADEAQACSALPPSAARLARSMRHACPRCMREAADGTRQAQVHIPTALGGGSRAPGRGLYRWRSGFHDAAPHARQGSSRTLGHCAPRQKASAASAGGVGSRALGVSPARLPPPKCNRRASRSVGALSACCPPRRRRHRRGRPARAWRRTAAPPAASQRLRAARAPRALGGLSACPRAR